MFTTRDSPSSLPDRLPTLAVAALRDVGQESESACSGAPPSAKWRSCRRFYAHPERPIA
jgi:hypothetical protein